MQLVLGVEFLFIATLLAVLAFFVLDAASRAQGWLRPFGKALGVWLLVLIALALLMLVVAPFFMPLPETPRYSRWLNES